MPTDLMVGVDFAATDGTETWIADAVEALAGEAIPRTATTESSPRQKKGRTRSSAETNTLPFVPDQLPDAKALESPMEWSRRASTKPQATSGLNSSALSPAAPSKRVQFAPDNHGPGDAQPQAKRGAKTIGSLPAAEIQRAIFAPKPRSSAPAETSLGGQFVNDCRQHLAAQSETDEGQYRTETQEVRALVGTITEQHRRRWDMIRARQRLELQGMAVCRRLSDGDKGEAAKLWAAVVKDAQHPLRTWLSPYLAAMQPLLDEQKAVEKLLVKNAKRLPIYEWAQGISGLGDVSLAAIVGECAAPVGEYKSVSAVWKRMGLAVIGGERQRRIAGEAAIEHGYNAQRRSIMWNIGACLIKAQVRKDPADEEKRIGIGEYGALYLERKVIEAARVESKAHAHNRAQRYVEKRLLRELWKAWRKA